MLNISFLFQLLVIYQHSLCDIMVDCGLVIGKPVLRYLHVIPSIYSLFLNNLRIMTH